MTTNANEETEMTQEFGQLVRILTGSSLQIREAAYHRNLAKAEVEAARRQEQERQQQEQLMAEAVNEKLRSESLWANQDATEIADHVIVAAHLGETHETALSGYHYASDMLRDNYGINLAEMNRDHPTAWADQHAALQQALRDHYAAQQALQEADQQHTLIQTSTLSVDETLSQGHIILSEEQGRQLGGMIREYAPTMSEEHQQYLDLAEHIEQEQNIPATQEAMQQFLDVQEHIDQQLQASGTQTKGNLVYRLHPELEPVVQHTQEVKSHLESKAAALQRAEQDNLNAAAAHAAEHHVDAVHAQREASTGGRQPDPYQRVTDTQREQLNSQTPGHGDTRQRQGMQFTKSSQERVDDTASSRNLGRAVKQPREAHRRVAHQQGLGVSR